VGEEGAATASPDGSEMSLETGRLLSCTHEWPQSPFGQEVGGG
jgi:hypothetical protein